MLRGFSFWHAGRPFPEHHLGLLWVPAPYAQLRIWAGTTQDFIPGSPSMTAPAPAAATESAACVRGAPGSRDRPAWWLPRYARRRTAATAPPQRAPTPLPNAGTSLFRPAA